MAIQELSPEQRQRILAASPHPHSELLYAIILEVAGELSWEPRFTGIAKVLINPMKGLVIVLSGDTFVIMDRIYTIENAFSRLGESRENTALRCLAVVDGNLNVLKGNIEGFFDEPIQECVFLQTPQNL